MCESLAEEIRAQATVDQARDDLDEQGSKTVYDAISGGRDKLELGDREVDARRYVSSFGFRSREQSKKVESLSGGERNRAHLAALLKEGANVIVLDEPTNDLDVGEPRRCCGVLGARRETGSRVDGAGPGREFTSSKQCQELPVLDARRGEALRRRSPAPLGRVEGRTD